MNPDGSVALLNYREDGVTREGITILALSTSNPLYPRSLSHFLEGRPQRG